MGVTRYIFPVLAGTIAGMICISLGESFIYTLYAPPQGINFHDKAAFARYIQGLPDKAFMALLVNYAVCSFIAGLAATIAAKRIPALPAIVVGIVLTLGGLYNVIRIPQPLWFSVSNVAIYLPCAYLGYIAVRKRAVANAHNHIER